MVVFVNIHERTADLFSPCGAGDLIKDVPFAELAPVHPASMSAAE